MICRTCSCYVQSGPPGIGAPPMNPSGPQATIYHTCQTPRLLLVYYVNGRAYRNPPKARKPKQAPQHSSNVPPFVQQAVAERHKIGVVLVSHRSRVLDKDNLVGGAVPWVNALRYAGYLRDDDPLSVEVFYEQRKCARKDERTDIYLFVL